MSTMLSTKAGDSAFDRPDMFYTSMIEADERFKELLSEGTTL